MFDVCHVLPWALRALRGNLYAVVLGVLNCVFMVERDIKKLLLDKLKETGDDPEDVTYSTKRTQMKGKKNSSVTERKSTNIILRSIQPSTDTPPLEASRINPESATSI